MQFSRRLMVLTSVLTLITPVGNVFANPTPPPLQLPSQTAPTFKPTLIKQEITAELFHTPPKVGSIILRADMLNKDGSRPPKGFKVRLSAGEYSCDAEVANIAGNAFCAVTIPFAKLNSDGTKLVNVGKKFTINATIPPEMGTLTIKDSPTRQFTLLSQDGYAVKVFNVNPFVNNIILPAVNSAMPKGILFNNYRNNFNPLLQNGSWVYLSKADPSKVVNFHFPKITVTDKYGVNLLHGDFYVNRMYVQPSDVRINNTQGTFELDFTMTGFDGSGPSIVGLCREGFCPNWAVPDFTNLKFDTARASYKVSVVDGKFRVKLVDSQIKLNFSCSGGFQAFCGKLREEVNKELPTQFQAHLRNPALLQQAEVALNNTFLKLAEGKVADLQICPPNSANCNEGEILLFHEPKDKK